jgi:hypothetical protein
MPPTKNLLPSPASPAAKLPGPHGPNPNGTGGHVIDTTDAQVRELALDLVGLSLDLAGIIDPTPVSDGASALLSIARGNWFDAIISGASMVPYVGDLAKAGKLPRYLKSVEKAIVLAQQSDKVAAALLPAFRKLKQGLDLLPAGANAYLDRIKILIDQFLKGRGAATVAKLLPDISGQFAFKTVKQGGKEIKTAEGWLGVPGKVMTHRSSAAQKGVSGGTGDDAGHMIGNQFGAPGDAKNLSLQNWVMNRGGGTWHELERQWADLLQKGYKVRVKVTDVAEAGARPYHRKAEWTLVHPDGKGTSNHSLDFLNATTPKGRAATGEVNPFPPGHQADVIPIDRGKKP